MLSVPRIDFRCSLSASSPGTGPSPLGYKPHTGYNRRGYLDRWGRNAKRSLQASIGVQWGDGMTVDLSVILPNISNSLDGTGFLFGAGTSCEAGYPMMPALTRAVIGALTVSERSLVDDALSAQGCAYDDAKAEPNIEQLSDYIIAHLTNSNDPRFAALEARIRTLIVDHISSIKAPILDHHIRFFEALKKRAFGLPCTVWIFTTNYDLLFEMAAAACGIALDNGFCGAIDRFFLPSLFTSKTGMVVDRQFRPSSNLTIKLVKLHGSISWTEEASKFIERHPAALAPGARRVMILPRRRKIMDTLAPPYDTLFTLASRVIGTECRYLVSCGFSYSDEHINQNILLPIMQGNKCRMFALSQTETAGMGAFRSMPNFQGGFEGHHLAGGGKSVPVGTDLWKFSELAKLF